MNSLLKSIADLKKRKRYGVFVTNHHLLGIQPESTRLALITQFPDRNPHEIMVLMQQGDKCMVREGKQDSLVAYAARLYSQGFQVEVLPLD